MKHLARFTLPLFIFFLLDHSTVFPQNFWQQTSGPLGGEVRSLLINSAGNIFAGHDGAGIYRSSDNGAGWTVANTGLTNGSVNALALNTGGEIFAGTFDGVFLSTNNGNSWTPVNTGLTNKRVRALALNSAGDIFAGTEGGVFRSSDNGKTWTPMNSGLTDIFIQAFVINNTTGDIFAGTSQNGVFRSTNNGGAWRPFNSGLTDPVVRSLAINGQGNIFAGTNSGVFRLLSTTATWTQINTGLTNLFIPSLFAHSNGNIFAGTEGGAFRSADNGNNWTAANTGLAIAGVNTFANNASGNIFAGTTGGVFRSTNNGVSWAEVNSGMITSGIAALANKSTGLILAGTRAGRVFRSKDEGESWTLVSTGLPNDVVQSIQTLAVSSTTGDVFAGTAGSGVYRSSNDGNTWTPTNNGLPETNVLALASNAGGDMFAGGASDGLSRSTDNGDTWTDINNGLTNTNVRALAINASGHIFAGTGAGVFRSINNGENWTPVNNGIPGQTFIEALAINVNGEIYAGSLRALVYRSKDNGDSWAPANSGLPSTSTIFALTNNATGHVFAGTSDDGVFRTIDNGAKWAPINSGLSPKRIESLAINAGGFAFAGTGAAGVFRSVKSTAPAAVSFSNDSLNFGKAVINSTADLTVALTNTGFANLSVNATSLAGANAAEFNIINGSGSGTIAPAASRDLTLRFAPNTTGNKIAYLIVASNAESTPDTVTLTGTGTEPLVAFSNSNLQYDNVLVNTNSVLTVKLTNTGTANLSISSTNLTGANAAQFSIVSGGGTRMLAPNESRDMTLRFAPTSTGNKFAYFVIASTAASSPDTVTLTGTGAASQISFSTDSIKFSHVLVNGSSNQTVTLTNTGSADLSISSTSLAGTDANEFSIVSGGGAQILPANTSRQMILRFAPQSHGNKSAALVITSNAGSSPDTIALAGVGSAPLLALSRSLINFNIVLIGANSEQTLALTNSGTADLNITSAGISGQNAAEFSITSGGNATTLTPSASQNLTLRFAPSNSGARSAVLVITSDAASSPDTVQLRGSASIVSVQVNSNDEPDAGSSVNLAITTPPNFQPTSRWLFYRQAGQTQYDSTAIAQIANSYQADIPPEFVTLRGVEYYVRLADGQTVVTFPPVNAPNQPQTLRVRVREHPSPLIFAPSTYRMISAPVDLDSAGFADVLEEFAEYDTLLWRLFRWQNDNYAEHTDIAAEFTPGNAFWLITRAGDGFGITNALSTDSAQPFDLTLQPGWNQIANPFAFPVEWDSVSASGPVDTLAFWNGLEYQFDVTVLEPWEGYFINNLSNSPVTLTIPPVEADTSLAKRARPSNVAANEYRLRLSAQLFGAKLIDTQNFVGLLNNAQIGRDALDFAEPPAIGDYIQLSIVEDNERFAGNFKPLVGNGQQWDVEIRAHLRANVAKKFGVTLQEIGPLPEGFARFILDKDYGTILPANNNTFRIDLNETFPVRHLKIIVGTKAYAESHNEGIPLIPLNYVLEQNYPNPFAAAAKTSAGNLQTTIRYQLNKRTPVVIEIRNLLGQKIRTLANELQSTGQHTAIWNGLDETGRAVTSGIYFYTLKTEEFIATRKLVLMR